MSFLKLKENLFPLLGKYDQFIDYNVQKESYKGYPLKAMECGHVTGALSTKILKEHILESFINLVKYVFYYVVSGNNTIKN